MTAVFKGPGAGSGRAFSYADAALGLRHVFVRDLRLQAGIGLYDHERGRKQTVIINLDLAVLEPAAPPVAHADVVCYDQVTQSVRALVEQGHVDLVETLAETIAELCLRDPRVARIRVRVEKPEAIPDAASAGIEIERTRR